VNVPAAKRRLAILAFHSVGESSVRDWNTWFYIPEATFTEQLQHLRTRGWHTISHIQLLQGLAHPDTLDERTVLLTFDDGYRSMVDVALPILESFGYPAVLFVPTAFIGGYNSFEPEGWAPKEVICDWEELQELERRGVSVQSHGVSHRPFSDLSTPELVAELERSKAVLEDGLGKAVDLLSYPYGDAGTDSEKTRQLAKDFGYAAACLYGGGPFHLPPNNQYRLERVAMGPDTDLRRELEAPA